MNHQNTVESNRQQARPERGAKLFVATLILVAFATYGYKLLNEGIFDCPPDGYEDNWYLAYCNASAYGDFDRGAHWYPLVPDVIPSARKADILIIGSSRMQFGFSSDATQNWFDTRESSYYLMGFTHTENIQFFEPMLKKVNPAPNALVVNVDEFFEQRVTAPTAALFNSGDAPSRYRAKQRWQTVHRWACTKFNTLCGTSLVIFRNDETGRWRFFGTNKYWQQTPTDIGEVVEKDSWDKSRELAEHFLSNIDVDRSCVIFTVVPSPNTPFDKARWLANQLNIQFIAPDVHDYRTRDNSHLDPASAERWSQLFFTQADDALTRCLGNGTTSSNKTP